MHTLANAISALTPTLTQKSDARSVSKPRDSTEAQKARRNWLRTTLNRYMAASGVKIEPDRITVLGAELDREGYTSAQARAAETWILKGAPARFGNLTLPDFFPTPDQLASVQHDATADLRREYERGYQAGRAAGITEERRSWEENVGYLELQREASRASNIDMREKMVASREAELDERVKAVDERDRQCRKLEAKFRQAQALGIVTEDRP